MKVEDGIKLQAHLDGELTGREAQEITALIESDAESHALFAELQQTRSLLSANEPEFRLPESREFFWSKIEREISRHEAAPVTSSTPAWLLFFRRHLTAIGGTAVAAALVMFVAVQMNLTGDLFEEIDNPLDDTSSFSFRSESQQMTLVWISNPFADSEEVSSDMPMPMPATELQ
jgi:anti-sigma factor RsiW